MIEFNLHIEDIFIAVERIFTCRILVVIFWRQENFIILASLVLARYLVIVSDFDGILSSKRHSLSGAGPQEFAFILACHGTLLRNMGLRWRLYQFFIFGCIIEGNHIWFHYLKLNYGIIYFNKYKLIN